WHLRVDKFSRMPTIDWINAEVGIHMSYDDRYHSGSGYTTAATYLQWQSTIHDNSFNISLEYVTSSTSGFIYDKVWTAASVLVKPT
nr:hypothetical protein [Tanacetum cinerariifolium]